MDLTIIIGVAVVLIVILLVINHNRKSAAQEAECCVEDAPYKVETVADEAPVQQVVEPEVCPAIFADPVVEEPVKKPRKPRAAKAKTKKKTKKSKAV